MMGTEESRKFREEQSHELSPSEDSEETEKEVFADGKSVGLVRTGKRGAPQAFARKLYDILEAESRDIITWNSSGNAFIIANLDLFRDYILMKYFRHQKFPSFQRQLNLYGFRKIARGPDTGAYAHKYFIRQRPDLLDFVRRSQTANSKQLSKMQIVTEFQKCKDIQPLLSTPQNTNISSFVPSNPVRKDTLPSDFLVQSYSPNFYEPLPHTFNLAAKFVPEMVNWRWAEGTQNLSSEVGRKNILDKQFNSYSHSYDTVLPPNKIEPNITDSNRYIFSKPLISCKDECLKLSSPCNTEESSRSGFELLIQAAASVGNHLNKQS